jgi:hypothetical protein
MGQSLEIELGGKTTVPEAVDKSKKAIKSLGEQIGDVRKKFGESFKDIFLSFLGPMALIGAAIGIIGKMIADNQKKQEDANQAAIDGTNKLMSAEENYYANKRNNEKKGKEAVEQAKTARENLTQNFLEEDLRGKIIARRALNKVPGEAILSYEAKSLSESPTIQAEVKALIAKDMATNPLPGTNVPSFKGPEGFSNIVGVGANPVIEAMTRQVEIQDEILKIIKEAMPPSRPLDIPDFTKKVPLSLQKAGIA